MCWSTDAVGLARKKKRTRKKKKKTGNVDGNAKHEGEKGLSISKLKRTENTGHDRYPFFLTHCVLPSFYMSSHTLHIINHITVCNSFQMPFLVCVFMRSIERDEKLQTTSNALSVKD